MIMIGIKITKRITIMITIIIATTITLMIMITIMIITMIIKWNNPKFEQYGCRDSTMVAIKHRIP